MHSIFNSIYVYLWVKEWCRNMRCSVVYVPSHAQLVMFTKEEGGWGGVDYVVDTMRKLNNSTWYFQSDF